jgi:hypothetical protein
MDYGICSARSGWRAGHKRERLGDLLLAEFKIGRTRAQNFLEFSNSFWRISQEFSALAPSYTSRGVDFKKFSGEVCGWHRMGAEGRIFAHFCRHLLLHVSDSSVAAIRTILLNPNVLTILTNLPMEYLHT